MYSYTIIQWLFFFYFYCFFGWCFESTFVSIKNKKLVNRGFMRGPFLPIYGTGAIMMLVVSMPFQGNIFLVYIAGCIGATALEFVTGVLMESLFKIRYWDYSNQKFNICGYICLTSSLAWGGLTILMTSVVHKYVQATVFIIPHNWLTFITFVLTAIVCADFALSFKAAMDLREILVKLEKAKKELEHIQKRLDVIIAVTGEELNSRKDGFTESIGYKVEDLKHSIEDRLDKVKVLSALKSNDISEALKEEIKELRFRFRLNIEVRDRLGRLRNFYHKNIFRSNPTMSSKKFKDALEELKRLLDIEK